MAIAGFPLLPVSPPKLEVGSIRATEFLSKIILSFIPNLHSGIPLTKDYLLKLETFEKSIQTFFSDSFFVVQ